MNNKRFIRVLTLLMCFALIFSLEPRVASATNWYSVAPGKVIAFKLNPPKSKQPANYAYSKYVYAFDSDFYITSLYNVPSDMIIRVKYNDVVNHYVTYCCKGKVSSKGSVAVIMRTWEEQFVWQKDAKSKSRKAVLYNSIPLGNVLIYTSNEVTIVKGKLVQ